MERLKYLCYFLLGMLHSLAISFFILAVIWHSINFFIVSIVMAVICVIVACNITKTEKEETNKKEK